MQCQIVVYNSRYLFYMGLVAVLGSPNESIVSGELGASDNAAVRLLWPSFGAVCQFLQETSKSEDASLFQLPDL